MCSSRPTLSVYEWVKRIIPSGQQILSKPTMQHAFNRLRHEREQHTHVAAKRVPVKRSSTYKFNGTASYLYALRKYGFQPPYALLFLRLVLMCRTKGRVFVNQFSRLAIRDSEQNEVGEVSTSDVQNDSMYLCPITVGEGNNAVTLHLDFDTGSADLWGTSSFD